MNQSMSQVPLFFDDVDDALRHAVAVLGGPKQVGPQLRGQDLTVDAAARWVSDCLNADRPAQFHPNHLMAILRAAHELGDHTVFNYLSGECGYSAVPIVPEDEAAELKRQFIESADRMSKMAARIADMEARAALRVVIK